MTSAISATTSTTPKLTFSHLLTKVIINVTSEDIEMVDVVTTVNAATEVDYNMSTLSYVSREETKTITMASNGTNSYKAIIVPQNIEAGVVFGNITVGDESFDVVFESTKILKAGCEYEFDLSIRAGIISFVSSSINDWSEGSSSSEGESVFSLSDISSSSYPTNTKLWTITDTEATADDFAGLRSALYNLRWDSGDRPALSFPNLTSLPDAALYDTDYFESISLPEATSIGASALYSCGYLALVEAPKATTIGATAFYQCTSLTSTDLSSATTIGNSAFYGCSSLSTLSLPVVTNIGTKAFGNCSKLSYLTLATGSQFEIFGDSSADCFYGLDLSNIALTVGDKVDISNRTLIVPVANNGLITYSSFAYITGGSEYEDAQPTSLEEYSATNYPLFSNEWVVNDTEAPLAYFIGINEALKAAETSGREISLSFPNLTKLPSSAFYIDNTSATAIVAVDAPLVASIGESTFYGASSIKSLSLPLVATISTSAFYGCTSLTELSLPSLTGTGTYAFYGCSKIAKIDAPKLAIINSYTFYGCKLLTEISAPLGTYLGTYAFAACSALKTVSLPILTTINTYAFYQCYALTDVSIPEVTTISQSAFVYCTSLASVSAPAAKTLGDNIFLYCSALISVDLPLVETVGEAAFRGCSALVTLSLPEVTSIGEETFRGCTSLTEVSLPKATALENSSNYTYDSPFYQCTALTTVSFPLVETIGDNMFRDCTALTEVSLPSVTSIGTYPFYGCSKLQSVSLPSLSVINSESFTGCYMLYKFEIASNEGVKLTHFGTYYNNMFTGIDISYMTFTTGSANKDMVDGNYITVPQYYTSSKTYVDVEYGPFKEIIIK